MTGFDTTFDPQPAAAKKTSGLAITSLIFSLICCIPTTVLGVLFGIGALVSISGNPAKKGKGIAVAGIVLGLLFSAGQAVIYPRVGSYIKEVFILVQDGPKDALTAGFAGDYDAFRAAFRGDGASASDEEVQEFIDQLQQRYGAFVGSHMDEQGSQPAFGQPVVVFPYVIEFQNETLSGEVEIYFSDPQRGGFVNKFGYITIFDPAAGDLEFPSGTATPDEARDDDGSPSEDDQDEGMDADTGTGNGSD
ncbi:MAG: DUF4190 domain-containing protein [Phycisphaerales bacterium]